MAQIVKGERPGVNPKWTAPKTILGNVKKVNYDLHISRSVETILEYVTRHDNEGKIPNIEHITTYHPIINMGCELSERQFVFVFEKKPYLEGLAKWGRYYEIGSYQCFFWHYQFRLVFPNHPNGGLAMYSIQRSAEMLAVAGMLGWKDAVIQQGYMHIAAMNRGYENLEYIKIQHRRAQAFILRLFCDWVGDVSHQWPAYAYDEPIYENLLAHWRTPDPDELTACLLAACDRHTWQTGRDSSKNFYDFSTPAYMRVPIEILFLFRLRAWEGLANPDLEHPLVAAPFDQLPPEQPVPPLDDLMQGVLKRAREDWPHYNSVLSLEELKKPPEAITLFPPPSRRGNKIVNRLRKLFT